MNDFYEWLYTCYVHPRVNETAFTDDYHENKREWTEIIETLSRHERIVSLDMMNSVKHNWGVKAFTYGVQVGMMLLDGLPEKVNLAEHLTFPAAQ